MDGLLGGGYFLAATLPEVRWADASVAVAKSRTSHHSAAVLGRCYM